jgi:hypothetical protein
VQIVQDAYNGANGNPLAGPLDVTVTSTGACNALIAGVFLFSESTTAPAATSVKLGTTSMAQVLTYQPENAGWLAIYSLPAIAAAQTTVAVAFASTAHCTAQCYVIEVSGLLAASINDATATGTATATAAWSSGTSGTTAQVTEIAVGLYGGWSNATYSPAGPGAPWVNYSAQTEAQNGGVTEFFLGYQMLNAKQTVTYSGTGGNTVDWNTAIAATFKGIANQGSLLSAAL